MISKSEQALSVIIIVCLGAFLWGLVLILLLRAWVNPVWFTVPLAAWIGAGAGCLLKTTSHFRRRMSARQILLAALVSPAWPWLK